LGTLGPIDADFATNAGRRPAAEFRAKRLRRRGTGTETRLAIGELGESIDADGKPADSPACVLGREAEPLQKIRIGVVPQRLHGSSLCRKGGSVLQPS
jgi:hypothetical protein